ncbi:MAG TPA: SPOR domain-containing protein [Terriglobales bacterium]|nr:SPOR domain-containing protein [Terriglobales bacterium]
MTDGNDTEITLGTGRLLGLFFGLVIVCAIFFGLGFSMGRNSVKSTLTMEENPSVTMPASATAGNKSTAGTLPRPATSPDCLSPGGCGESQTVSETAAPKQTTAAVGETSSPELSQTPLAIPAGSYTVQVAAVSKQEDADALVSALRKKSYPVFIASGPTDKLFHVQIGPFSDIKDAEAMKTKLTGDGYNPIVKR